MLRFLPALAISAIIIAICILSMAVSDDDKILTLTRIKEGD